MNMPFAYTYVGNSGNDGAGIQLAPLFFNEEHGMNIA